MLLFGMMNWLFTWLRPDGALTHEAMSTVVADLFFGGLAAVQVDAPVARKSAKRRTSAATLDHAPTTQGDTP
jgi:TetR/AcrR family transcriptional regulator